MNEEYLEEDLSYTRAIRKRVVAALIAEKLPESDEDRKYLATMLDGIDRSALAKSKIKIEDNNSKNQEHVAALVAQVLSKVNNRDLHTSTGVSNPNRVLQLDYTSNLTFVDGEMETGVKNLDYDELIKN